MSTRGRPRLEPRQRAALDAYAEILSSPPIEEREVVNAARAVIKVWAEVSARESKIPKQKSDPTLRGRTRSATPVPAKTKHYIAATLLEPEEVAPPPYLELTHDLMSMSAVEASTEVICAVSPFDMPTEVVKVRSIRDAG